MEKEAVKCPSDFDVTNAVKQWNNHGYDEEIIELGRKDMADYGLPFKMVSIYMDRQLNIEQAKQLSRALRNNVNLEFVKYLAEEKYSAEQMKAILNFTSSVPEETIKDNITSDMKAHAISKALKAVEDSLKEAKKVCSPDNEKVNKVLGKISEQLSELSQNAELIQKMNEKLDEMPKADAVNEESIRQEYIAKLEQQQMQLSSQQDEITKLMRTKAELNRRLEQLQGETLSEKKIREDMEQEREAFRKEKNRILDECDDAKREARHLQKEMKQMQETMDILQKKLYGKGSVDSEYLISHQERNVQPKPLTGNEMNLKDTQSLADSKMSCEAMPKGAQKSAPLNYQTVLMNRYGTKQVVQVEHVSRKGSDRLLALAGKKCFRSKAKISLIQQMKSAQLSKEQMQQIQVAIESGLTDEEVSDIINSGFDVEEMAQAIQILLADKMYQ